jgi:acyl-CoA synthetase (AMP-forming)/AMP-acid ligase II
MRRPWSGLPSRDRTSADVNGPAGWAGPNHSRRGAARISPLTWTLNFQATQVLLSHRVGSLIEPLTGRRWDPRDINVEVTRRMAAYAGLGLRPGDVVFIHYGNCLEFFADLTAVWQLGGCVVPIDGRLTPFEIGKLAALAEPRFSLWLDTPDATIVPSLEAASTTIVNTQEALAQRNERHALPTDSRLSLDGLATIMFTSGTTGDPKGVVHTHRGLRARWMSLLQAVGTERYRKTLLLLPTHFGHGLVCNALFPWLSGCDLFVLPPFRPDIVTQLGSILDEHEITFMSSVPAVWRLALRTATPPTRGTLERVSCGSAPLSAAMWNQVQSWTGAREVWNVYGITETASWLCGTSHPDFMPADGLVGVGWGSTLAVLRSSEANPRPAFDEVCAPGEPGFVWVNTPALMQGYFRRDDLTRKVVADGWFLTGDIGVMTGEGHLVLRGRERDEINKGGMKVFPADIDAVLDTADGVADVCAFAYEGDPLYGENIGVAIVMQDASDARLKAMYHHAEERLAKHQMPVRWYLVDALPRTARGKINRDVIGKHCAEQKQVDWRRIFGTVP